MPDASRVRVLIVDDSPTYRQMIAGAINARPDMEVVGQARDGQESVEAVRQLRPDIVLMDVVMPGMNGLDATREIMSDTPTPIVIVSASLESWETDIAFQAMRYGALAVECKPVGVGDPAHADEMARLLKLVRNMAGVRVIRHWKRDDAPPPARPEQVVLPQEVDSRPELIGIVASTGGPAALATILQGLPANFVPPVVIVQHIAPDFVASLAGWLGSITPLPVAVAQAGQIPQPGHVYLAPGGTHLRLTHGRRFQLDAEPADLLHVPSGDMLFESLAASYGRRASGVLLTGMGSDGARGLLAMRAQGAYTIAQDEASSTVFGMPREAARLGAVRDVMPLSSIAPILIRLAAL